MKNQRKQRGFSLIELLICRSGDFGYRRDCNSFADQVQTSSKRVSNCWHA